VLAQPSIPTELIFVDAGVNINQQRVLLWRLSTFCQSSVPQAGINYFTMRRLATLRGVSVSKYAWLHLAVDAAAKQPRPQAGRLRCEADSRNASILYQESRFDHVKQWQGVASVRPGHHWPSCIPKVASSIGCMRVLCVQTSVTSNTSNNCEKWHLLINLTFPWAIGNLCFDACFNYLYFRNRAANCVN